MVQKHGLLQNIQLENKRYEKHEWKLIQLKGTF